MKDSELLPFISAKRIIKVMNYHFDVDRKLSLYSALLIRMMLSRMFKISINELFFSTQSSGKPYLLSNPRCYFNFAHTKNFILCAASGLGAVGVDVERNLKAPLEIMNIAFHPIELQYIKSADNEQLINERFYKIWTCKEAYTKCFGWGITNSLINVNVLEPKLNMHLLTWHLDGYTCSIYSTNIERFDVKIISEVLIQKFYLPYCSAFDF